MSDDTRTTAEPEGLVARARRRVETGRTWAEKTIFWQVWERMLETEFVDRSVALAGKAFVSFFPLVIVVAAFMPARTRASIFETLTTRLGVRGESLDLAKAAFQSSDDVKKATGLPRAACSRSSSPAPSPPRCSGSTCGRGAGRRG